MRGVIYTIIAAEKNMRSVISSFATKIEVNLITEKSLHTRVPKTAPPVNDDRRRDHHTIVF